MVSSVRNLLCLTILTVLVRSGYAIRCYAGFTTLSSKGELIDCSSRFYNPTGCMKATSELLPDNTVRSCYYGDVSNKQGCQWNQDGVNVLACDICTEDGCNGSASQAPIAGAIILFFAVARLLA